MRKLHSPALLMALIITMLPHAPIPAMAGENLRIGGTGGGLELMRQLGKLYAGRHPGLTVEVVPSLGSSGGIKALLDGAIDVAITARPAKPEEKGAESCFLACTPLVFATHSDVRRKNVSTSELERIFGGTLRTWPDGSRIRLILRPETETDTKIVRGISAGMNSAVAAAQSRPGMILAVNDQDNLRMLKRTQGALGIAALAMLTAEHARVNVLSLNGVRPGLSSLSDGRYPLARKFYLVVRTPVSGTVRGFLEFVGSPAARTLLKKYQCLLAELS